MLRTIVVSGLLALSGQAASAASVEEGARLAVISGCHDCHTAGYAQAGGQVDPARSLAGDGVGFQGPWGTTYPANLRISLSKMSEAEFVDYARSFQTRPPMPWFNVHAWTEDEARSFYLYVKSLGEPGPAAPEFVAPGAEPKSPFIVFAPPQMPRQ